MSIPKHKPSQFRKNLNRNLDGNTDMNKVVELNAKNFSNYVETANVPVLVEFWAAWCAPCRMVSPIIDEIASEYAARAIFGRLDINKFEDIALKLNVSNIPQVLIFRGGEIVDRQPGVASKSIYENKLNKQLDASA